MPALFPVVFDMGFAERLAKIRKQKQLTQGQLAELIGGHVIQINRYENGKAQPTLDGFKKIVVALGVHADDLLFDEGERGPDQDFALEFEALSRFGDDDKRMVKAVLKGLILKHEAERWTLPETPQAKVLPQPKTTLPDRRHKAKRAAR